MDVTDLKINQESNIIDVEGEGPLRRRLLEMGILPNTLIKVIKKAPLGDPLEISIRGYELSLRKEDAKSIRVEVK